MACFHPITAYRQGQGAILFHDKKGGEPMQIPCRQCIGCKLKHSKEWAMRMCNEASLHDDNVFITLTYNSENLPPDGSLRKRDFQLFIKRLRKQTKKKFDIITAVNMEKNITAPIITQSYSDITSMIGSIYSTVQAVTLYTHHRLSKNYGRIQTSPL